MKHPRLILIAWAATNKPKAKQYADRIRAVLTEQYERNAFEASLNTKTLTRKSLTDAAQKGISKKIDRAEAERQIGAAWSMMNMSDDLTSSALAALKELEKDRMHSLKVRAAELLRDDEFANAQKMLSEIEQLRSLANGQVNEKQAAKDSSYALAQTIDLSEVYDESPKIIKAMSSLLASHNPLIPPAMHFLTSVSICGALLGKTFVAQNMGREYYCNNWFVGLLKTGKNKSAIRSIEKVVKRALGNDASAAAATLQDRFTMSFLFSNIGTTVSSKDWGAKTETERIAFETAIEEDAMRLKARIIFADEFAMTMKKIIESGTDGGELGSVLQLADSGSTISGSTVTSGYRVICDTCISIIGYTQPESWHDLFAATDNLASGLSGRFTVVDADDLSELNVPTKRIGQDQLADHVQHLVTAIVNKFKPLSGIDNLGRVKVDYGDDDDTLGQVWDELISTHPTLSKVRHIPWDALKGKLIYQALKYSLIFAAYGLDDAGLVGLSQSLSQGSSDPFAFNEPATASDVDQRAATAGLVNYKTYRQWLAVLAQMAAKYYGADIDHDFMSIGTAILRKLEKADNHQMTRSQLQAASIRLRGERLRGHEIARAAEGLESLGVLEVFDAGRAYRWTGKPLSKN